MATSIGKTSRLLGVCAALSAVASAGCEKMKQEQSARNEATREAVVQEYGRLGFMIAELDKHERQTISCRDDELPKRLRGSARMCERLALTDESNLRRLFGKERNRPPAETESAAAWSWMRTLSFARLGPLSDISDGTPLGTHRSALDTLPNTNVGVFTNNTTPQGEAHQRYRGFLVIFDTKEELLRCQIAIEADVSKIFAPPMRGGDDGERAYATSPRPHIDKFFREVDKQLAPITKNFCAE